MKKTMELINWIFGEREASIIATIAKNELNAYHIQLLV